MSQLMNLTRIACAVTLALSAAAHSNAASPALEWTATILGDTAVLSRDFTIDSLLPHQVTLVDNEFLAPFDSLALGVFKTGGATMGSLFSPGSFTFVPAALGSYTATLIGDPGSFNGFAASTFGVSVTAVPEAETWAMMVVGMGLVGWQIRRKVKASAASRFV